MDERRRLIKNARKTAGSRKERKEVTKRIVKAHQEERKFDKKAVGGDKEREQLYNLNKRYMDMQWDMVSFTNQNELWLAMQDSDRRTKAQRIQSQIFQQRAVFECFDQLRGGLSASNIIACVGMYVGMSAVNPEIRKSGQKMMAQALGGAAEYMENHPEKSFFGMRNSLVKNFQAKRDKYLTAANDGRMPFTAETAALAYIRLDRECYTMMRDGNHSVVDVMQEHAKATQVLQSVAAFDGVDMTDMAQSKRIILAKMMSETEMQNGMEVPTKRARDVERMYDQFDTTGGWQKAEPRNEQVLSVNEDGTVGFKTKAVWTGEYQEVGADGYTPVNVDPSASPTVREPYTKETIARHVSNIMNEYGMSYKKGDIGAGAVCEHTSSMGHMVVNDVFGKRAMAEDGALMQYDADMDALMSMQDNMRDLFERAQGDLGATAINAELRGEMSAALHLGLARGAVSDSLYRMYDYYHDVCAENNLSDETLLTRRPTEMSCLAAEYVSRCGGIDPTDKDFMSGSKLLSEHYAVLCVADSLGIEIKPGMDAQDAASRCLDAIQNNERANKMVNQLALDMQNMVHTYGYAYSGALAAGNTEEEVRQAFAAGFNDAAEPHAHEYDYQYEGGPTDKQAMYRAGEREAILAGAKSWAADAMGGMSQNADFATVFDNMAYTRYQAKADARCEQVNNRFDTGYDAPGGPEYE